MTKKEAKQVDRLNTTSQRRAERNRAALERARQANLARLFQQELEGTEDAL